MGTVIVCNLCSIVMLVALLAAILRELVRARVVIATALAFDPLADITPSAVLQRQWSPA